MSKFSNLAKNTLYLTVGQFGTKLLSFFLVPLYTNVLTTEEYGTFDFIIVTISLLIPILSLNICDATLRFCIDKDTNKCEILSISLYYFFISIGIGGILVIINYLFDIISIIKEYSVFFILLFAGNAINGILNCFARGIGKIKEVAISGVVCSIVMIGLNIVFLVLWEMGLEGFFWAYFLGSLAQSLYLACVINIKSYFIFRVKNDTLHQNMINYSKPMIINNISWWVNNVFGRYIIIWFVSIAANGIYCVSYKIPSVLVMFQGIFNQAWIISASQEFDEDDKNGYFSGLYNCYNACMVLTCSVLILTSKIIASLLYAKDFFDAWTYAPLLLFSSVFGALGGYLGGIFSAVKDTKVFAYSTLIGACVNVLFSIILVQSIGVMGAAIASALSFFIVWAFRYRKALDYIRLRINLKKDILAYIILILQSFVLTYSRDSLVYPIEITLFITIIIIYRKTLSSIMRKAIIRK